MGGAHCRPVQHFRYGSWNDSTAGMLYVQSPYISRVSVRPVRRGNNLAPRDGHILLIGSFMQIAGMKPRKRMARGWSVCLFLQFFFFYYNPLRAIPFRFFTTAICMNQITSRMWSSLGEI